MLHVYVELAFSRQLLDFGFRFSCRVVLVRRVRGMLCHVLLGCHRQNLNERTNERTDVNGINKTKLHVLHICMRVDEMGWNETR